MVKTSLTYRRILTDFNVNTFQTGFFCRFSIGENRKYNFLRKFIDMQCAHDCYNLNGREFKQPNQNQ